MKRILFAILISVCLSMSVLFADGDARPATQDEKNFSVGVMQTLDAAVPEVPAGWVIESKSEIAADDWISTGAEAYPLQVEYQQCWHDPGKLEEARNKEDQLIAEMAASMQSDKKSLDQMSAEMNTLAEAFGKAFEKNDAAEIARIQARMEELGNQINAYGDAQEKTLEARQQEIRPKDARVQFRYRVNSLNYDITRHSKETDIAGCAVYRREFDVANRSMEGEYVVFVGGFAPKTYENETWMELKPAASVPHTQVQSVILIVSGDKAHTRRLLESMDWAALNVMIGK